MFEFLDLTDTAKYYDQVMGLARTYRRILPLTLREVRHEAMVEKFASEVRGSAGFRWPGMGFRRQAIFGTRSGRRPNASDIQLAGGLNADGVGQWRRYENEIAPVLPILQAWVNAFRY